MRTVFTVMISCAIYATLRYNVFKGVAWSEWPVYVLNKVFALSSLLLLMIQILRLRRNQGDPKPSLLTAAWALMLLHAGLSLVILEPAYYIKYFSGSKLTLAAGWSMMLGVAAAVGLHVYSRFCERAGAGRLILKLGGFAFVAGLHAALLGYAGWFQPATWPGHMIPITLISFVSGLVALSAALGPRRGQ